MKRDLALLVLMIFLASGAGAQNPIALEFNVQQLREEFSDENANWTYMSSVENLYMPDKGDLFMHRNNPNSAYAFVSKWENNLTAFNIISRLKLGPAETTDQSIGIIFLVQRDAKGAVVVEFNKFKQFRVKQMVGSYYRYISGTAEEKGWVKSNLLRGKEDYNDVEVRVALPQVDVYINGKFVQSFDVPDYTPGMMGIAIGPNTKAKADYFYVYTTSDEQEKVEKSSEVKDKPTTPVEQISKLRYELEMKERSLRECQMERVKAVTTLEEQVSGLMAENDRLALQNRQLDEFRSQILVDMDEDAFLTIARSLKDEIIKNQRLEMQVQTYRDSLRITHQNYSKLKLALLDKSIKRAEVDKAERDRQESIRTKKDIEAELQEQRLLKEQEEWERKNVKPKTVSNPASDVVPTKVDAAPKAKLAEVAADEVMKKGSEQRPSVAAEPSPLPVRVRKAEKKID